MKSYQNVWELGEKAVVWALNERDSGAQKHSYCHGFSLEELTGTYR